MSRVYLSISSVHGTVDVRKGLPAGYTHVPGSRLQPICRKLGIKFAEALVGFVERGRKARYGWKPLKDGVVVAKRSAPRLLHAAKEREQRASNRPQRTPEMRASDRRRREERDIAHLAAAIRLIYPGCPEPTVLVIAAHACEIGSGRVGRTSTLDIADRAEMAVRAHVRHCRTEYEHLLMNRGRDECAREDAREVVRERIEAILNEWEGGDEDSQALGLPAMGYSPECGNQAPSGGVLHG